jgi:hypothetical protein
MNIEDEIKKLANSHAETLAKKVQARIEEMQNDDTPHFLIYRVLGITNEEGRLIDVYQNKGRFLYKYAGSFLESAALLCFKNAFPNASELWLPNTEGKRPKEFQVDCAIEREAIEIKWRDATTDGDHVTKEHTRLKVIQNAGYVPVRVMFYYPNRTQAIKIQQAMETLYKGANGFYYWGEAACALRKASESKNAVIKILISTESDLGFDVTQVLSDIILIDSTTKAINKELQRFKLRDNGQTNPQSAIRNPQ